MGIGCMSCCVVDVIITGGDEEDACMWVVHPGSLSGIIKSWVTIHFPLCAGWWISNRRKNNDGNDLVLLPLNGIMRMLKIRLGANCCMHYSCVIPCVKRHLAHNRFMLLLWLKDGADLGGTRQEDKQVSYQTRKGTDNSLIVICWHASTSKTHFSSRNFLNNYCRLWCLKRK